MNIYLGEHFETFIREQVATGRYANASEVVREALRNLETGEETRRDAVRAFIKAGLDDVAAGRVTRVDDIHAYMEQLRERTQERIRVLEVRESVDATT